ncbi:MAG: UvrD-helicase domain-containing protein [Clostridia bacterium]|nr:UvrD-helicase domain-containing protein [Clostridia bacterium]
MPQWTPSQSDAIRVRNTNLLVSAGAGSGKTTVLTHRLLERIRQGENLTDFLVVTFTNASASDLRSKLYGELSGLVSEEPGNRHFRKQLYLLPEADIGTIDSFCGRVVRSHFQLLGLSPKLRIADDQEAALMRIDAMTEAIEEGYESGDGEFLYMADTFTGMKDDVPLLETLLDMDDRLRAFEDGGAWIAKAGVDLIADAGALGEGLFSTSFGKRLRNFLISRLEDLEKEFSRLEDRAEELDSTPATVNVIREWKDHVRTLALRARQGQNAFLREAEDWSAPGRMSKPASEIKHVRDRLKAELDNLKSLFSVSDPEVLGEQFRQTGRVLLAIWSFLGIFRSKYGIMKKERGRLDFADTEHMLLELLEKDGRETEVCSALRSRFHEIYIDEYQDVSPIQDRIFRLLSNGRNRFMVGDVKQSIYRFRNAYPDIFLAYKDAYADVPESGEPEEGGEGCRIFLRENFRSGAHILSFSNLLFRELTEGTPYEREYKGEDLICARESDADPIPVAVTAFPYDSSRGSDYVEKDARAEEAAYIADRILERVRSGDRKYGDFALLFFALKGKTKDYEDALRARGIPYTVTTERPFFEQPEIRLALAALRTVDDPTDDISLFGTMRSPMFGFSADDLYALRKGNEKKPLISAVREAAGEETDLGRRCGAFLARLEEFRSLAEERPCHMFLWDLYLGTGLLYAGEGRTRDRLLALYEKARSFESSGYKGLSGFLSYLRVAEETGSGIALKDTPEAGSENCVTLTTIHRSKGLEYPVVFLCDAGRTLNRGGESVFRILRGEGVFFPLRDMDRMTKTDTILFRYAKASERSSEFGETLRKLYVGCTRAKEELFVTGTVSRSRLEGNEFCRFSPSSVLELVLYAAGRNPADPSFRRELPPPAGTEPALQGEPGQTPDLATRDRGLSEEQRRALEFRYDRRTDVPAKITASELKRRDGELVSETKESRLVRPPAFLSGESGESDAALAGTANHAFLQFCDYAGTERDGLTAEARRLVEAGFLTAAQEEMLDFDGLDAFFRSDLFGRIRKSPFVGREKAFSVLVSAGLAGGERDEQVVLQGLIDCCFEEPDGTLTIVDYKTDRVRNPRVLADRYHLQLLCYRLALEEMTGKKVGRTLIWSFSLDRAVDVDLGLYGGLLED